MPQLVVALDPNDAIVQREADGSCSACARPFGAGRTCMSCRRVAGLPPEVPLAGPGLRLGGYLLDGVLALVTLGIGWLIWSLVVWGRGQTPGKQLLGMRCIFTQNLHRASWGRMALRQVVGSLVMTFIVVVTFGIGAVLYFWLLWDKDNQELWDKLASTLVVRDRDGLT